MSKLYTYKLVVWTFSKHTFVHDHLLFIYPLGYPPWLLRGAAASSSPHPLPSPLCSFAFPNTTWVMSCSGLCHWKSSILMFAGAKVLLNYFEWSDFFFCRWCDQVSPASATAVYCEHLLLRSSLVWQGLSGIFISMICHLSLAFPLHVLAKEKVGFGGK